MSTSCALSVCALQAIDLYGSAVDLTERLGQRSCYSGSESMRTNVTTSNLPPHPIHALPTELARPGNSNHRATSVLAWPLAGCQKRDRRRWAPVAWAVCAVAAMWQPTSAQAQHEAAHRDPSEAPTARPQAKGAPFPIPSASLIQQAANAMNEQRLADAVQILSAVEAAMKQAGDRSLASFGEVIAARASALDALGQHEKSLLDRQLVVALAREALGDAAGYTLTAVLDLAKTLQKLERWQESTIWLSWALSLRDPGLEAHDELAMFIASKLARGYERTGEAQRGLWLRQHLVASFIHHFGAGDVCEAGALQDYAGALLDAGLSAEALKHQRRAVHLLGKRLAPTDPLLRQSRLVLERIHELRRTKVPWGTAASGVRIVWKPIESSPPAHRDASAQPR